MNEGLEFYKDEERIMSISGYAFPQKNWNVLLLCSNYSTYDLLDLGTWKNRWQYFNNDISIMKNLLEK